MEEDVAQNVALMPVPLGGGAGHDDALGVTIFPITPPQLLAAVIKLAETPRCSAEILCRLPNNTFEAVSDPVRATPSQPSNVPKNGYSTPAGEGQTHGSVQPRIAREIAQREHGSDGEERKADSHNGLPVNMRQLPWGEAHQQTGDHSSEQDARALADTQFEV